MYIDIANIYIYIYIYILYIYRQYVETSKVIKHLKDVKDAFIKRGYRSKILDHHFKKSCQKIRRSQYR